MWDRNGRLLLPPGAESAPEITDMIFRGTELPHLVIRRVVGIVGRHSKPNAGAVIEGGICPGVNLDLESVVLYLVSISTHTDIGTGSDIHFVESYSQTRWR